MNCAANELLGMPQYLDCIVAVLPPIMNVVSPVNWRFILERVWYVHRSLTESMKGLKLIWALVLQLNISTAVQIMTFDFITAPFLIIQQI